jgi:D-xylose 1-dehydrogenase (NADP+, D-xylono-1,5-lactone-forming)
MSLRWGVLGCADITNATLPAIAASTNGHCEAIASRDGARAQAWAERFDVPRSYAGYESLLAAHEVDAIYIPLPNSLHGSWAIRALEAGYPVLVEKPLTGTLEDALRLAEAAARTGLPVIEAFMYRYHPLYDLVERVVRDGGLGTIQSVDGSFSFLLEDEGGVVDSAELEGGALRDVGCYALDLVRQVGAWVDAGAIRRVAAFARHSSGGVDETMLGLIDFEGGLLGRFETSIASAERHRVEIVGTDARLVIDDPWVAIDEAPRLAIQRHGQPDEPLTAPAANAYTLQFEQAATAFTARQAPRWGIDDAVANMRAVDALDRSARTGRVVEL